MKKLDHLLKYCLRNLQEHPEYECYPHWTFLLNSRTHEILSTGLNRRHEPSRKYGYHRQWETGFIPKLHSELDAVMGTRVKPGMFYAVNVRLNKSKEPRISSPCKACKNLLWTLGCDRVYYTINEGWECVKLI